MARKSFLVSVFVCGILAVSLVAGCGGGGGSAPGAPTGLVATIGGVGGELVISWTASTGATSYNLYWGNTPGVTTTTGTKIAGAASPYSHTGLTNGTRYYYVATAVNGDGESAASTEAGGLPQIDPVGVLDTTLGGTGYVRYLTDQGYASGIAVDGNGRSVLTGTLTIGANTLMALWRFNADGTPDTTFGGGDGLVTVIGAAGGTMDEGTDVAIDGSGRIVVVGYSQNLIPRSRMIIWRFLEDGSPDTAFGTSGVVSYDRGIGGDNWAEGIAIDAAGRIVVSGNTDGVAVNREMTLWRYTEAGTLDTSFAGTGVVFQGNSAGGGGIDSAWKLAINASGGIAVVGESDNPTDTDLVIWRFTDAGALDTSFGGDGIVLFDRGDGDSGFGIAFDDDSRVLVTGKSDVGAVGDLVVLRYTAAGELDTAFSDDGIVIYDSGNNDGGDAIMMDSRQRPVIVGSSGLPAIGDTDIVLLRLTGSGAYDTSFDGDGYVIFSLASQDGANALAFDATGRVLIAGATEEPGIVNMLLLRYE